MLVSDNCTTAVNHDKSTWYTSALNMTYGRQKYSHMTYVEKYAFDGMNGKYDSPL